MPFLFDEGQPPQPQAPTFRLKDVTNTSIVLSWIQLDAAVVRRPQTLISQFAVPFGASYKWHYYSHLGAACNAYRLSKQQHIPQVPSVSYAPDTLFHAVLRMPAVPRPDRLVLRRLYAVGQAVPVNVRTLSVMCHPSSASLLWQGDPVESCELQQRPVCEAESVECADQPYMQQPYLPRGAIVQGAGSFLVDNLVPNRMYVFRVSCRNPKGASLWSEDSKPVKAAGFPGQMAVPSVVWEQPKLTLSWDFPDDYGSAITQVSVEYNTYEGSNRPAIPWPKELPSKQKLDVLVPERSKTWSTAIDDFLRPGVFIIWRVRAQNGVGYGEYSNTTAEVLLADPPESPPFAPVVKEQQRSSMVVSWEAPSNSLAPVITYKVWSQADTPPDSPWVLRTEVPDVLDAIELKVVDLTPAVRYRFKVKTVNAAGESKVDSPVSEFYIAATRPSAPEKFVVTKATTSYVSLSWEPPDDGGSAITGYALEQKRADQWTLVTNMSSTDFVVRELPGNVKFGFRVNAINEIGAGPWAYVEAWTVPGVPQEPLDLVVSPINRTSILFSWIAPDDGGSAILGFYTSFAALPNLEYRLGPTQLDGNFTQGSRYSIAITNLMPSTTYNFTVFARNRVGDGPNAVPIQTIVADLPGSPDQITFADILQYSVQVSWIAPKQDGGTPITDYIIEHILLSKAVEAGYGISPSWGAKANWTRPASQPTGIAKLGFNVGGLDGGQEIWFRVIAKNGAGFGPPGYPITPVAMQPSPPSTPEAPAVLDPTPQEVTIDWPAPLDGGQRITGYGVQQRQVFLGTPTTYSAPVLTSPQPEVTVPPSARESLRVKVASGTRLQFRVAAINGLGVGSFSDWTLTQLMADLPGSPQQITVKPKTASSLQVTYTAPLDNAAAPILFYELQHESMSDNSSTAARTTWTTAMKTSSPAVSVTVPGLKNGFLYRFKVRAWNEVGAGNYGTPTEFVVCADLPQPVLKPQMVELGTFAGFVRITWSVPAETAQSLPIIVYRLMYAFKSPETCGGTQTAYSSCNGQETFYQNGLDLLAAQGPQWLRAGNASLVGGGAMMSPSFAPKQVCSFALMVQCEWLRYAKCSNCCADGCRLCGSRANDKVSLSD